MKIYFNHDCIMAQAAPGKVFCLYKVNGPSGHSLGIEVDGQIDASPGHAPRVNFRSPDSRELTQQEINNILISAFIDINNRMTKGM